MRDTLLAVSGKLDLTPGGHAVDITDPASTRRTVYGYVDRQNLPDLFRAFDFASPDTSSPRRFYTTVPQQALFMMNSPFVIEQAKNLVAGRISRPRPPTSNGSICFINWPSNVIQAARKSNGPCQFIRTPATAFAAPGATNWLFGYGAFDEGFVSCQSLSRAAFFQWPRVSGRTRPAGSQAGLGDAQRRRRPSGKRSRTCRHPAMDCAPRRNHHDQRHAGPSGSQGATECADALSPASSDCWANGWRITTRRTPS
jgi:hypothetical protein